MNVFTRLGVWWDRMFNRNQLAQQLKIQVAQSDKMSRAIEKWKRVYLNNADWLFDKVTGNPKIRPSGVAALVCSYISNLITLEFESSINQDTLNEIYQNEVMKDIRQSVEYAMALGGIVFKPYQTETSLKVDIVKADNFLPTSYSSSGFITGAIFFDKFTEGELNYTRVEEHKFNEVDNSYKITNTAFKSNDANTLGEQISLKEVKAWQNIEASLTINNVDKPLFAYFKPAISNNVEIGSPLGISFFHRAIDEIQTIDEHKQGLRREFRVKEAKQYIDITAVKDPSKSLPYNEDDYYIKLNSNKTVDDLFESYSPSINDQSFLNTLNGYYMNVENLLNLERGVLSHGVDVGIARTATEIEMMKHRTYENVVNNQTNLRNALTNLGYALSVWFQLDSFNRTIYDMKFNFDDSVVNDPRQTLSEMLLLQNNGNIPKWKVTAWYFNLTEEEAKKLIEEDTPPLSDNLPPVE